MRSCIKCRKVAARPNSQLLGQQPADHLKPGLTFGCVGVDYAGPMLIKSGPIRKPLLKGNNGRKLLLHASGSQSEKAFVCLSKITQPVYSVSENANSSLGVLLDKGARIFDIFSLCMNRILPSAGKSILVHL